MNKNLRVRTFLLRLRFPRCVGPLLPIRPANRKSNIGRRAAQLFRMLPLAGCGVDGPIPRSSAKPSLPPQPDTLLETRAGGNAWLNTSVDYDTNKIASSLPLDAKSSVPRYVLRQPSARNTNGTPDPAHAGRNRHPR